MFDPTRDDEFTCPILHDQQRILKRSINTGGVLLRTVAQGDRSREGVYSVGVEIKFLGWFEDPDAADDWYEDHLRRVDVSA